MRKFQTSTNAKFCELSVILTMDRIREPAGAFKARGTPEVLRIVEIMTIRQSRTWGVCNLNEFRKVCGMSVSVGKTEH